MIGIEQLAWDTLREIRSRRKLYIDTIAYLNERERSIIPIEYEIILVSAENSLLQLLSTIQKSKEERNG